MTQLEAQLGYEFKDKNLLTLALTHPSYLGLQPITTPKSKLSNQRLEFLGDSILGLIFAVYLMDKYPTASEGQLTQLRSQFVCGKTLASVGRKLSLQQILLTEKSYRITEKDVADTVESLIGAVYHDGGILNAEQVILNLFAEYLDNDLVPYTFVDYKSNLQKLIHKRWKKTEPIYKIQDGANGTFLCKVFVNNNLLAMGTGTSKKRAEVAAAEQACARLTSGKELV